MVRSAWNGLVPADCGHDRSAQTSGLSTFTARWANVSGRPAAPAAACIRKSAVSEQVTDRLQADWAGMQDMMLSAMTAGPFLTDRLTSWTALSVRL